MSKTLPSLPATQFQIKVLVPILGWVPICSHKTASAAWAHRSALAAKYPQCGFWLKQPLKYKAQGTTVPPASASRQQQAGNCW